MSDLNVMGKETLCEHEYEGIDVYGAITAQNAFKCTKLSVNGSAQLKGGCTCMGKISVNGSMESGCELNCEELLITGILKADDSLSAQNIKIMGNCTVAKSVKAESISSNGNLTVGEAVDVKSIDVPGNILCAELTAKSIDVSGRISVDKEIDCTDLDLSGKLKCKKLKATAVNVSGRLNVDGDVECETADISGSAEISGLLNAENISIKSATSSKITNIGCSKIEVNAKSHLSIFSKAKHEPTLTADLIEGDDIILENTHAKLVRGKNIHINKNCKIDVVEYTESYDCAPSSSVGEVKH